MKTIFASLLLLVVQFALADPPPTGYDVMRIDFPAEQRTKLFAGCDVVQDSTGLSVWCQGTYPGTYVEPPNAGRSINFGTIDPGFYWYSDSMGACRLHAVVPHDTYTTYHLSCYTDRISADGFEDSGITNEDGQ